MDESQIPQSTANPQTNGLKRQFTTVTPFSKFLAMVLFVSLPFIGFWFGIQYQAQKFSNDEQVYVTMDEEQTSNDDLPVTTSDEAQQIEDSRTSQESQKNVKTKYEIFMEQIRVEYPDIFTTPSDYTFEWRWRDSNISLNAPPHISKIQGKVISTSEFSFQDLHLGEQSLLYQIENTLPSFFGKEGFTQALANDADHPTNGSSVQGYERMSDGTVCLRIIEDTESEFLNYKIACGTLVGGGLAQSSSFSAGQYIEWEGKVSEYVQDCGGGENCLSYLRISLPEKMNTDSIFEARINIENCVDKTLRGGETVKVIGHVQNVVPDIGLILSCADTKTSVTRK